MAHNFCHFRYSTNVPSAPNTTRSAIEISKIFRMINTFQEMSSQWLPLCASKLAALFASCQQGSKYRCSRWIAVSVLVLGAEGTIGSDRNSKLIAIIGGVLKSRFEMKPLSIYSVLLVLFHLPSIVAHFSEPSNFCRESI